MGVLISPLYPSYLATKVSLSCFSSCLILVRALYPSWTITIWLTFSTFNSKASCCSENDGIEKPPITHKMSVIRLGVSSACHHDKPGLSKFEVKVQECSLTEGYCWPFDPVEPPLATSYLAPWTWNETALFKYFAKRNKTNLPEDVCNYCWRLGFCDRGQGRCRTLGYTSDFLQLQYSW